MKVVPIVLENRIKMQISSFTTISKHSQKRCTPDANGLQEDNRDLQNNNQ